MRNDEREANSHPPPQTKKERYPVLVLRQMGIGVVEAELVSDIAPRKRMKRINDAQGTSRASRPSTSNADMPMASGSRCTTTFASPLHRMDTTQPRQSKRIATPRPQLPLTPGGNVPTASPPIFRLGVAPPRRAETPLQRLNRVNGIHPSSTKPKPSQSFQCVSAACPPRTPSEAFLSPSFRSRFPASVRSAKPPMSSAKAKLDFSKVQHSASAAPSKSPASMMNQPAAWKENPRLEVLARRIQLCIDERRWHDAMRVIEEALHQDSKSSILQMQKALVHSRILVTETSASRRLDAEAAMKHRRDTERAQRAQHIRQDFEKSRHRTFYDVLKVRSSATSDEIKIAYRVLVLADLQDLLGGLIFFFWVDKNQNTTGGDEIKCITEAYQVLSDATQRRSYDATIRAKRMWR